MYITKRDGTKEEFSRLKIKTAIKKAIDASNCFINDTGIESIVDSIEIWDNESVESIQDQIEEVLADYCFDAAKEYITYRASHNQARKSVNTIIKYIDNYIYSSKNASSLSNTDDNANVSIKNISNLDSETHKAENRLIMRALMKRKLNELYPDSGLAKQYVADINSHIIYAHDESSKSAPTNYCEAVSLYPIVTDGSASLDGLGTKIPTHLDSFCGQMINVSFLLAGQCKGAVAFSELFNFLDYYCVKDFGENYPDKEDLYSDSEYVVNRRTIGKVIEDAFQKLVYNWNQPAGNRGAQSPFVNISYFDSNYWKALFSDFVFPDGTKPEWRRVDYLQKKFMRWFNKERTKTLLTFPVETMALLTDGTDVIDKDYKLFNAQMYAEGHSFFTYISDNPNGLASCCFSKDTKFLWRASTSGVHCTTFAEFNELPYRTMKENMKIFHNGSWVEGKVIKLPARQMYKVVTYNNKEFIMTDNHINPVLGGEKTTDQLTTDDYLLFNTSALSAVPECNEHLTFSQGFVIGAFLGDGSFGSEIKGTIYETNISQNKDKVGECAKRFKKALAQMGLDNNVKIDKPHNNVYNLGVSCKELVEFIIKWTNWYRGTYAFNKELNLNCLTQSVDFRRGILAGWYNTDGGNSNRCYTTSPKLAEQMEALITSLGMQSIIDISDRTNEKVIIRDEVYDRNYPLYCVRWYSEANHRINKDKEHSWIKYNNGIYFKIKSIEPVDYSGSVYCIECKNKKEPYFTLPCGLITHNCRLRNEILENVFSFTNGLTGVQTGSCNVLTLNLNRIVQDCARKYNYLDCRNVVGSMEGRCETRKQFYIYLKKELSDIVRRVHKYHIAYKTILYEMEDRNMITACTAGYISIQKLFSTVGINGLNEAALALGISVSYNNDYKEFCKLITGTISSLNKEEGSPKFLFNTEMVPAESLGVKNYNWDKEDKYWVPEDRNLYNSYFYDAHDGTSVLDKMKLHGREFTSTLDGGVGCHINLYDHLSIEQYLKLTDLAIKFGTSYYTYNIPNTQCEDCKSIYKQPLTTCPKCGSKNVTQWTRIIGYLRPIKSFSEARAIEAKHRRYLTFN